MVLCISVFRFSGLPQVSRICRRQETGDFLKGSVCRLYRIGEGKHPVVANRMLEGQGGEGIKYVQFQFERTG